MQPMLADEIKTQADLINILKSSKYAMEQKFDGKRLAVEVVDGEPRGWSRKGELAEIPTPVAAFFDCLNDTGKDVMFDGELLGNKYVVFDMTTKNSPSYSSRRTQLDKFAKCIEFVFGEDSPVVVAPVWFTDKKDKFIQLANSRVEGVVFKKIDSNYTQGRSKDILKFKFTKTADVIVSELRRNDTSQGITISCWDNGKEVEVGGCKIPEHVLPSLEEGDVIEVRYLYATDSNKLVQPVYLRMRDDKNNNECVISQLIKTNKEIQV